MHQSSALNTTAPLKVEKRMTDKSQPMVKQQQSTLLPQFSTSRCEELTLFFSHKLTSIRASIASDVNTDDLNKPKCQQVFLTVYQTCSGHFTQVRLHLTYIQLHNTYGGVHLTYIRLHPTYAVAHHKRKAALPHTQLHITHVWQHTAYAVAHLRRMAALRRSGCTSHTNGSTPHTRLHIAHVWQHSAYAVAHHRRMAALRTHGCNSHTYGCTSHPYRCATHTYGCATPTLHQAHNAWLPLHKSHSQILTLKTALPLLYIKM